MAIEVQQLNPHELEIQSTDASNYPFIKMRGNLVWNGSAWTKWDGSIVIDEEDTDTATTSGKVTVGNTSTSVLASNSSRIATIIVNDSDEDVYVNLSGTAVMNEGIRLNAHGGSLVEKNYTGAVTAICASGGKNITVTQL